MGMGKFPICKLIWDLLRTSVTAFTIDKNTFCAPFGILYVTTEIWNGIFQKVTYKPLMGFSLFSNSHFQMGVTVMGFAEHFGHSEIGIWYNVQCELHFKKIQATCAIKFCCGSNFYGRMHSLESSNVSTFWECSETFRDWNNPWYSLKINRYGALKYL